MLKVIDLDQQGKDVDGFVFTLTLGDARYGVTDQEVIEFIKNKYASAKSGSKKTAPRKSQAVEPTLTEAASCDVVPESLPAADGLEASH